MTLRSWLRHLFARPASRPMRKAPPRSRLAVEALEDRTVPAAFTVVNTLNGGTGSLRWAVDQANTTAGADTINFSNTLFNTAQKITLTGGQLTLTDAATTTITGPGANLLSISGNNASRVIAINSGASAALSGLTITEGFRIGDAPGLLNQGTLTLTACTITGNACFAFSSGGTSFGYGGGLFNEGTATLIDCTISGNDARLGGGGVENRGTATLTNCSITDNNAGIANGGGFENRGTATLTNCTISDNSSRGAGGGVFNQGTAPLTLTSCTVSGNRVRNGPGGGLFNQGTAPLTMTNCTVSHNTTALGIFLPNEVPGDGGGLFNEGTATLSSCTISSNFGFSGGGVYNRATATLTNCTVSGNSADAIGHGGGLANHGTATLTSCTVSDNRVGTLGGGGGVWTSGTLSIGNTIVSGNELDTKGVFVSRGNNLIGATDESSGWVGSDRTGTGALLAPLGDYGGPTPTHALLPGSPALNAGTATGAPGTDQRGLGRVGAVDIGAFESRGFAIALTSGTGQSTGAATAFAAPLVVTVTANSPSEPVAGGVVTFTPPASGASAALSGSSATISNDGTASVTATANSIGGSYTVSATAGGIATPASFSLTNTPRVVSIVRASPKVTTARKVKWTVTFSEAVTGVDLSDFRLKRSAGLRGVSLVSVTGSGSVWTVTARTGTGTGKLGLNLVDDDSIVDAAGTPLGGTGAANGDFTGAIYTKR